MQQFISQDKDSITISNFPVSVNGSETKKIELTEEEQEKLNQSDRWKVGIDKDKLKFTEIVKEKTAEQVAKEELKAKLEAGTATESDVKEALKMLL